MHVLFICTANVCRSPLAHGYLQHLLDRDPLPGVSVSSAGVYARTGSPAFECSQEVALKHGFDLSAHRARQFTPDIAQTADLILCMETFHAHRVLEIDPDALPRVALLGKYHPANQTLFQIRDPRQFSTDETLITFSDIKKSVDAYYSTLRS